MNLPNRRWPVVAFAAAFFGAAIQHAAAQDSFYKGKTVTLVVGYSAGGGYDQYARLVARHLGNHIPGNPTVIVQNMPGAASMTSVRYLDATAPKDGTVITTFDPGSDPGKPGRTQQAAILQLPVDRRALARHPHLLRLDAQAASRPGTR